MTNNQILCETLAIFSEVITLLTKEGLTFVAIANEGEFIIELTGGF